MFDELIEGIRLTIAGRVFKVRVRINGQPQPVQRNIQMNAQHQEAQSMSQAAGAVAQQASSNFNSYSSRQAAGRVMAGARQGDNITVRRTMPKVGRNDPCPCGSGKKYKQCHGR